MVVTRKEPTFPFQTVPSLHKLLDLSSFFSKPWSGSGGAAFSGGCYEGVLSDWVLSPHAWSTEELDSYFSVPADELSTLDLWTKVSSFIVPGVYPALTDVKGALTNGALLNGESSDFVI